MTDQDRKVMKLALDALLDAQDAIANEFSIVDAYADEIEALRQALAQPDDIQAAVLAERDACAKVCEGRLQEGLNFEGCAAAIRARSKNYD